METLKALGKQASYFEIMSRILTLAQKPCLQSNIIRKCGLSTTQWRRYRKLLLKAELLKTSGSLHLYKTTEKGREFLTQYAALVSLLEPVERERKPSDFRMGFSYSPSYFRTPPSAGDALPLKEQDTLG